MGWCTCSVKGCKNNNKRNTETGYINFFKFPKDLDLRKQWAKICNKDKINFKFAKVCSIHFTDDSFTLRSRLLKTLKFKKLNHNAIPTLFVPNKETEEKIEEYFYKGEKISEINGEILINNYESCSEEKKDYKKLIEENPHRICGKIILFETVMESLPSELLFKCTFCHNYFEKIYEFVNHINEGHLKENKYSNEIINDENGTEKLINLSITPAFEDTDNTEDSYQENIVNILPSKNNSDQNQNIKESKRIYLKENIDLYKRNNNTDIDENIETKEVSITPINGEFIENDSGDEENSVEICDLNINSNEEFFNKTEKALPLHKFKSKLQIMQNKCIDLQINLINKAKMCKVCNKTFSSEKLFQRHKENCRVIQLYESKVIEFKESNNEEEKTIELIKDNLKCRYCGVRYKTRIKCIQHECTHNGISLYNCEICGKGFIYRHYFKVHLKIHEGIKPNKCHLCKKSFTRSEHLKIHLQRHLNERNYKCNFCDKSFVVITERKIHEVTHTGERTHLCSECGKCFASKTALLHHYQVFH